MEYKGKLYGKSGNIYFPLQETTEDVEALKQQIKELKKQCNIPDVVQQSEQLKGKYTKEFEDWLLGFEKKNEKYIVDDEQINTKEEMHDLYREL